MKRYEDTISNLPPNDFDALSEILAMSDNLFLNRLRSLVESALAEILSLKNITSMLYLADRCNALQLKETCMQFIAVNLPLVLETRLVLFILYTALSMRNYIHNCDTRIDLQIFTVTFVDYWTHCLSTWLRMFPYTIDKFIHQ